MSDCPTSGLISHKPGLDVLRICAAGLVTADHALSLTDHESLTTLQGVNVGELGVAIFVGISGLLSSTSHRSPTQWLSQRLCRIYPAYWLTMLLSFTLASLTGYKSFTWKQFLSQMLGTGLLTHEARELINMPSWFISLILLCYLGQFAARLTRRMILVDLLFVFGAICWLASSGNPWPWRHLITFFLAAAVSASIPANRSALGFAAAGLVAHLRNAVVRGL